MASYTYFKDMEADLKSAFKASESKISKEISEANQEYDELMRHAESKGSALPQEDAQIIENRLMELQYKIQDLKSQEENRFIEKQNELNEKLMKRIKAYLEKYCAQHGIDVVLNYMELNQNMLYGNSAFDITNSVVEGLNAEYALEKKK